MIEDVDYIVEPLFGDPNLPHSCSKCDNRWSGVSRAHCKVCHRTFTSVTAFDNHRDAGRCADPMRKGLVLREFAGFTAWGCPAPPDLRFRRSTAS